MSQPRKLVHLPKVRMLRPQTVSRPSGIRITHIKSITPPDPEILKKQEEEKLRAQLQKEIVSRSRTCTYKNYECNLPVLSEREFCCNHILSDPTAPYKQCAHTFSNGERCPNPAPIEQRDRDLGLCFDHARASLLSRQKAAAPPPPAHTTESLLLQLQHYVRLERPRTTSCASSVSVVSDQPELDMGVPSAVDPFKQIDATAVNAQYSASIMECASASDSDSDSVTMGGDMDIREEEEMLERSNMDPPCEGMPLWRAGVYTAEEAVSEAKNVLRSLQSAYIRQMSRLKVLLQSARAHYVKTLKAEKETYCTINSQSRSGPLTVRERRQLRKLKAYAGYHRKHGVDAVLARKLHGKRAKQGTECNSRPLPVVHRCSHSEGGVRCSARALPAAAHCAAHILHDHHQVLFSACGDPRGCGSCREPAAKLPLPHVGCRYHAAPPHYTAFTVQKDDSGTDSDSHSSSEGSQTEDFAEHSADDRVDTAQDVPETSYQ